MPSRYHSEFPERKLTAPSKAKDLGRKAGGGVSAPATVSEHTAAWPKVASPRTGKGYAATGFPVVKAWAAEDGLAGTAGGDRMIGRKVQRHSPAIIVPRPIVPFVPTVGDDPVGTFSAPPAGLVGTPPPRAPRPIGLGGRLGHLRQPSLVFRGQNRAPRQSRIIPRPINYR